MATIPLGLKLWDDRVEALSGVIDRIAPPPTPAREAPGNQSWKSNFLAIAINRWKIHLKVKLNPD